MDVRTELWKIIEENKMWNVFFDIVPYEEVQTAGVRRTSLGNIVFVYNKTFIQEAIERGAIFDVVLHEYLHVVMNHHERISKLRRTLGDFPGVQDFLNICADIAINQYIPDIEKKIKQDEFYKKYFLYWEPYIPKGQFVPFDSLENYFVVVDKSIRITPLSKQTQPIITFDKEQEEIIIDKGQGTERRFQHSPTEHGLKVAEDLALSKKEKKLELLSFDATREEEEEEGFYASSMDDELAEKLAIKASSGFVKQKFIEEIKNYSKKKKNLLLVIKNILQRPVFAKKSKDKKQTFRKHNKKGLPLPVRTPRKQESSIVVLVDCSSSMSSSEELWSQLANINQTFSCYVVPFNGSVQEQLIRFFKRGNLNKSIPEFKASGDTNFNEAVRYALRRFGERNIFIVISDLMFEPIIQEAKQENFFYITSRNYNIQNERENNKIYYANKKSGIPIQQIFFTE